MTDDLSGGAGFCSNIVELRGEGEIQRLEMLNSLPHRESIFFLFFFET